VRYLNSEPLIRRPRTASRARTYAPWPIPRPRVPVDSVPMALLDFVLEGLTRMAVTAR
jgi:hypothetical protein